ncbi:DUF4247 domain-containing protein [Conexibacter sp. SYSU D00693]|uniref:DUF4247 domain-containing protein n=1 Tax=Conexibacter sp. SYSU D00693 TaxID=2812560 RepID=UPI00196A2CA3|nr:DUF4247 domain-containing protein [Conexibacter sp. SYSU D00693]
MTVGRWGLVVAVVGLLVVGYSVARGTSSVRGFVEDRCRSTGVERDPQGRRADAFTCRERPSVLAAALAKRHKPAERRTTASGLFLRYSNQMVGVLGGPGGRGSKVLLARERDGYGFFYPYVGGWWGTYSGRGESFRGGGPGGGK